MLPLGPLGYLFDPFVRAMGIGVTLGHKEDKGGGIMETKQILCPTDFSEFSRNALDYALALAKWHSAKVTVLHVVPQYLIHKDQFPYAAEPPTPPEDFQQFARRELLAHVDGAGAKDVSTESCLLEGETVDG
jgi:nucleotide-binding universal stress UspA family protein